MNSKMRSLNAWDVRSFFIYAFIVAIGLALPHLPDFNARLVGEGISPELAGYIITLLGILGKKLISGTPSANPSG